MKRSATPGEPDEQWVENKMWLPKPTAFLISTLLLCWLIFPALAPPTEANLPPKFAAGQIRRGSNIYQPGNDFENPNLQPHIKFADANSIINMRLEEESMAIRFLALGDSYTIGEGIEADGRWPVQLARKLREKGFAVSDPQIIARTGWTTSELARGILDADPQGPFRLVSLMIGVNNQYRGLSLEHFRKEFRSLLNQAVAFAGNDPERVIVLSIPDWGATPFGQMRDRANVSREISLFNQVIKEEAQLAGSSFVDVTPSSHQVSANTSLVAPDGLHPSASMYSEWATLAMPAALNALDSAP